MLIGPRIMFQLEGLQFGLRPVKQWKICIQKLRGMLVIMPAFVNRPYTFCTVHLQASRTHIYIVNQCVKRGLLFSFLETQMETSTSAHNTNGHQVKDDDDMEQYKLSLLRSSVEKQDPTSKEVDDAMLKRFLCARDLDIEKASSLFLKYLKWRREFVPNGFVSEAEISNDLSHKKYFLQGSDKDGRPIAVVFGGKHFPNKKKGGLDEFKRSVVYFLDKICSRMPRGQEKFVVIADLEGWGYSCCDIRGYIGALSILQDCYPERLGRLLLVHVPSIFMTAWKMIYPFIDNGTRKKITFIEKRKLTSTLLQDIDESQLPQIYGGKLPLVPIEDN